MSELTNEQKHNAWLRAIFNGPDEDVMRVENTTQSGTPDLNICKSGIEIWIESKVSDNGPILRKEQYAWGMRRHQVGGSTHVITLKPSTNMIQVDSFPIMIASRGDNRTLRIISAPSLVLERAGCAAALKKYLFPMF